MNISIVGAGKLGTAIARLAISAGHAVNVVAKDKPHLALILGAVLPEARLVPLDEAAASDVVVLAVPRTARDDILQQLRAAHSAAVIIDATNPWEATGTADPDLNQAARSQGAPMAGEDPREGLPGQAALRVIRTLNHVSYEELAADARSPEQAPRRAIAVVMPEGVWPEAHESETQPLAAAGIDTNPTMDSAARTALEFVDSLGFDAVPIPPAAAHLIDPSGDLFGAWLTAETLEAAVKESVPAA